MPAVHAGLAFVVASVLAVVLVATGARLRGLLRLPVWPGLRLSVDLLAGSWALAVVVLLLGIAHFWFPGCLVAVTVAAGGARALAKDRVAVGVLALPILGGAGGAARSALGAVLLRRPGLPPRAAVAGAARARRAGSPGEPVCGVPAAGPAALCRAARPRSRAGAGGVALVELRGRRRGGGRAGAPPGGTTVGGGPCGTLPSAAAGPDARCRTAGRRGVGDRGCSECADRGHGAASAERRRAARRGARRGGHCGAAAGDPLDGHGSRGGSGARAPGRRTLLLGGAGGWPGAPRGG